MWCHQISKHPQLGIMSASSRFKRSFTFRIHKKLWRKSSNIKTAKGNLISLPSLLIDTIWKKHWFCKVHTTWPCDYSFTSIVKCQLPLNIWTQNWNNVNWHRVHVESHQRKCIKLREYMYKTISIYLNGAANLKISSLILHEVSVKYLFKFVFIYPIELTQSYSHDINNF